MIPASQARFGFGSPGLAWIYVAILGFHLLALNPYLFPQIYDNVVYYLGAQSIAEMSSFSFNGVPVVDWPPGFSLALALPFWLFGASVMAAKLFVFASLAVGLLLLWRLLAIEDRRHALLILGMFALLPATCKSSMQVMSELPYFAISVWVLLLIHRMRENRSLVLASAVGLLFGAASLTRWVGIALGAAILFQFLAHLWARGLVAGFRSSTPEIVAGALGFVIFVAWQVHIRLLVASGEASFQFYEGTGAFHNFRPDAILLGITDLFFSSERLLRFAGLDSDSPLFFLMPIPAAITLLGLAIRSTRLEQVGSSAYTWAVLLIFLLVREKHTRYLLPIAPFLLSAFFIGLGALVQKMGLRESRPLRRVAAALVAGWLGLSLLINVYLLVYGNQNNHAGVNILASPDAGSFYLGEWRDLYLACERIREIDEERAIGSLVPKSKYIGAFCGRPYREPPFDDPIGLIVTLNTDEGREQAMQLGGVQLLTQGAYAVYRHP